jgi:hypothetical protein
MIHPTFKARIGSTATQVQNCQWIELKSGCARWATRLIRIGGMTEGVEANLDAFFNLRYTGITCGGA